MTMEQARGRTGTGNGGKTGRKTVRGKDPEAVAREQFEAWMQRIMERFDRQDRIISVLINKDAAGVKYMDGERLYDNQDLCEMLRTSKRSGVHQPEHGGGGAGRREGAEDEGRGKEETGQGEKKRRRETCGGTPLRVYRKGEKRKRGCMGEMPAVPEVRPAQCLRTWAKGKRYDKKTDKRRKP